MKRPGGELMGMPPTKAPQQPVGMCIKMLVSPKEGAAIIGPSGSHSKQISEMTGSRLHLSSKGEYYPGTQLQELFVKGPSADSVANCILQVLNRLQEETGRISGGENEVEDGGARVHFVVPVPSIRALIGKSGENIKDLRMNSGMKIHVEEIVIGAQEMAEQVVSCAGNIVGLNTVVPAIIEKVNEAAVPQPWFQRWAFDPKACPNGNASYASYSKGKGKDSYGMSGGYGGYGGGMGGYGGGGYGGGMSYGGKGYAGGKSFGGKAGSYGKGYSGAGAISTYASGGKGQSLGGSKGFATSAHVASVDMLSAAVSAVPDKLADAADRSQSLQLSCPSHLVAGVVGKNGTGLQEIGAATGTELDVRDTMDASEKAIVVSGGAIGCVSAYLHVISRMATLQDMMSSGTLSLDDGSAGAEAYDPAQADTSNFL
ncbi:BTR1 [Symbiodinium natans]|uniref:BTR1 protein n=1 Tax=Symbiodinium natans TaxID=878477 RepID=A0A812N345_9DINO|nr:BTR1 [Symbiodinium natans]